MSDERFEARDEARPFDIHAADRVGPVADDDWHVMPRTGPHAVGHRVDIRIDAGADVLQIDDERVLIPPKLMQLALWMSRYYVAPLGTVLESVIPSAVKKKVGVGYSQVVSLARPREAVQEVLEKTRAP